MEGVRKFWILGEFFTELTGFAGRGGLRRRRCGELLVTRNWWRVEDDVECWILDFEWWIGRFDEAKDMCDHFANNPSNPGRRSTGGGRKNLKLETGTHASGRWLGEKCSLKRLVGELPNIRFLASPSTCDIENFHAVISDEFLKDQCRTFIARRALRQVNPRFPVLLSKFRCSFAPASKRWCDGENYHGIRVPDIPFSPLKVARRRSFFEVVLGADDAVFSLPSLGTPASMREAPVC